VIITSASYVISGMMKREEISDFPPNLRSVERDIGWSISASEKANPRIRAAEQARIVPSACRCLRRQELSSLKPRSFRGTPISHLKGRRCLLQAKAGRHVTG